MADSVPLIDDILLTHYYEGIRWYTAVEVVGGDHAGTRGLIDGIQWPLDHEARIVAGPPEGYAIAPEHGDAPVRWIAPGDVRAADESAT